MVPSDSPISAIPSTLPTLTGAVIFVEMNQEVIASLTHEEIANIITSAEDTFGVYPDNVKAEVSYEITGAVSFEADETEINNQEIIALLQESIADTLNVHSSDVDITIDPETGVATYTIVSSSAEDALELQGLLYEESINEAISNSMPNAISNVPIKLDYFSHI